MEIRQRVREMKVQEGWCLIRINNVPDQPGVASQLFTKVAAKGVPIGLILQNASMERVTDVSFTVKEEHRSAALESLRDLQQTIRGGKIEAVSGLATVEIVGTGILTDPSYVGRIFRTLADAGVNILAIGTSEIRITVLVQASAASGAQSALYRAFKVDEAAAAAA